MSALETAVQSLAGALDALEAKLDEHKQESAATSDFVEAARRQARVARLQAVSATEGLGEAIGELRTLLGAPRLAGD